MPPAKGKAPKTSSLQVNVYDGRRRTLASATNILYRVIDGNQKQAHAKFHKVSQVSFKALPFYDNFGDNYTIIAWADGYHQAGFTPLKLSPSLSTTLDLMLIPKEPRFNFASATWDLLKERLPFLASGVNDATGRDRYEDLMESKPKALAGMLNITTAMEQIHLPQGSPLDYLKQIKWDDSLAQDRFYAYCDRRLVDQVRTAAAQGVFAAEMGSSFFHRGATASWKQVQFGEANVQLTFHEGDEKTIDGVRCILVEPDIDYFKDIGAHALLEVLPHCVIKGLTNPEAVYVLRWIAGRRAGVPEFDPPYTIEK